MSGFHFKKQFVLKIAKLKLTLEFEIDVKKGENSKIQDEKWKKSWKEWNEQWVLWGIFYSFLLIIIINDSIKIKF